MMDCVALFQNDKPSVCWCLFIQSIQTENYSSKNQMWLSLFSPRSVPLNNSNSPPPIFQGMKEEEGRRYLFEYIHLNKMLG